MRALADGTLAAAWMLANSPDPEAYDLRLAWSKDGGATWSKPVNPHHDRTETQHGFASLFQAPGAGLGLVWLDGRATNPKLAHPTDNMSLRAAIFSRAGVQLSEMAIDTRVCDCCPTSVAVTAEGPIVAFRNRSDKEIRDIYVSRLAAGRWTTPVAVHNDGWEIEACPVNGPAISARGRDVAVGWFTALKDEGKAFVAFSHDAGRTFGPPVRVDDESAIGHVGVELLKDGSAAVSWIEFANERQQFKVRRVEADGARTAAVDDRRRGRGTRRRPSASDPGSRRAALRLDRNRQRRVARSHGARHDADESAKPRAQKRRRRQLVRLERARTRRLTATGQLVRGRVAARRCGRGVAGSAALRPTVRRRRARRRRQIGRRQSRRPAVPTAPIPKPQRGERLGGSSSRAAP